MESAQCRTVCDCSYSRLKFGARVVLEIARYVQEPAGSVRFWVPGTGGDRLEGFLRGDVNSSQFKKFLFWQCIVLYCSLVQWTSQAFPSHLNPSEHRSSSALPDEVIAISIA